MKDGEQIYVYPKATSFTRSGSTRVATVRRGPLAINRATAKELEALDGIGPVLAARIVTYRSANGPFATVEDLLKVSGIGAAKFAQFKEKVRV
jgi:competence protein ComEA